MPRMLIVAALLIALPAGAQEPTLEELAELVRSQEARIAELERQQATTEGELAATVDFVDTLGSASAGSATTIGGYGELHLNQLSAADAANDVEEIDFHRFVLFVGHRFSERVQFMSELEIEHVISGDGQVGEVELEQAYVDIGLSDSLSARAGLFLLPIGFLNETHEPPRFYGVERNDIESIIVPTSWWEGGGGLHGTHPSGFSFDLAMHSGLAMPTTGPNAFRVRSGRQKVAEALNSDWAYTARLRYTGWRGLDLALSYQYQSDPSQIPGDGLDSGQLLVANLAWQREDFTLKALYGGWRFDGDAVAAAGADFQRGWYVEPAYRLSDRWGVYTRFQEVDAARELDRFSQVELGFNFWLNSDVVFKFDVRQREHDIAGLAGRDFDGFDLGFGYQF